MLSYADSLIVAHRLWSLARPSVSSAGTGAGLGGISTYYAHSANPAGKRQLLADHLRGVAILTARFAAQLGAGEIGRYLGLWHDIGKMSPDFQQYLLASEAKTWKGGRGPDHKLAGALLARDDAPGLFALALYGHHGGLPSLPELQARLQPLEHSGLDRQRLEAARQTLALARRSVRSLEPGHSVALPPFVDDGPLVAEMLIRMLFSCLVDADALDTEKHFDIDRSSHREYNTNLSDLWARFQAAQRALMDHAQPSGVNDVRREVYQACLEAAALPPGLFRLAVPTGGGKTLSAMAFALEHARVYGQERVIVAVPFITITEQTAGTYRAIFEPGPDGGPVVLEHHSGHRPDPRSEEQDGLAGRRDAPELSWTEMAAENWDAPIVVTTTVQLFESLFAHRPSRCRKLHNLARSVIILDEAQALPSGLLEPILDGLRELCSHYGTTVVLSTATQPAFRAIKGFNDLPARDIVPDAARYFALLKRVEYDWRQTERLGWEKVADMMRDSPQALAVVNTKKDAMALLDALDDPGALHLSTLLCGAHRRKVIDTVRRRLAAGEECRLVSTQVIEAGVDLDFPLVLRALAPLDSIIQAAGRCNREGRLEKGRVVVFQPAEGGAPGGDYATGIDNTRVWLGGEGKDPHSPADVEAYFRLFYPTVDTDRGHIQALRRSFDYPEVASRFRMIPDATETIVVPYGTEDEKAGVQRHLYRLRHREGRPRQLLRALQPYVVSVYSHQAAKYRRLGLLEEVLPDGLLGEWRGAYDAVRGICPDRLDLESLVF